ncbi:helix-turn-helix transcriptional regulator [Nissabacter archeti]|uniref:Arabinose operon regulatory protein n=1 Tax=Nissabacter archeti TaxID=1917880 RepID=A0ABS5JM27_9GAMM|nr:helix-turn-helix transcriptional regulator [Nissabacter archeti]MBS0970293.1 helix-turn-helix transcriptional regulator [Nissabacter archeti]
MPRPHTTFAPPAQYGPLPANAPGNRAALPRHLFFREEHHDPYTDFLPHTHPWGQVIYVKSGVVALNVGGQRFLAPPEFAVWLPPHHEHSSSSRRATRFRSINIAPSLCHGLPESPCLLGVSAIFTAIVDDCFARHLAEPATRSDLRLCRVLIDQLRRSSLQRTYLPTSQDKLLAPVLRELERNPADNTPLAVWAQRVYTTERTLSRRCRQDLGMAFSEWRQRLRFLHAISLLEQGKSVQQVALELGYSASSAFIAMFRQIAGTTPERFRRAQ